jgi:alcohol dehydrogenase (NADP+)
MKVEEKKTLNYYINLNNGMKMPMIGLGTYKLEEINKSIKTSVKCGYRLFDTAKLYENEEALGKALNECIEEGLVTREELFVQTKLWNDDHDDPMIALKESLTRLNMSYVDSYIIHWPIGKVESGKLVKQIPLHKTWKKLEECVKLGLTKSIAVSNFCVALLLDLCSYADILPVTNQVEMHPYLIQQDLVEFCAMYGIVVAAYNPILRGVYVQRKTELFKEYDLFKNDKIIMLSNKYNKTPSQVILNWHVFRGVCALPKSSNATRQEENLKSIDFIMDQEDYNLVSSLNINMRFNIPKEKPFSGYINIYA